MEENHSHLELESANGAARGERGGIGTLVVLAAALAVGTAIVLVPRGGPRSRMKRQARRDQQLIGLTGFLVGAGLAALLAPESGGATRKRLGMTLSRIKVGAVERIERLRQRQAEAAVSESQENPVRSIQELGRDPNSVF
jgi:hypothetical protein